MFSGGGIENVIGIKWVRSFFVESRLTTLFCCHLVTCRIFMLSPERGTLM